LQAKGYTIVEPSLVQTADLVYIKKPTMHNVKIETVLSVEWLENQCRLLDMGDTARKTLVKIIANIQAPKVFIR
jgi:hypothetical protein